MDSIKDSYITLVLVMICLKIYLLAYKFINQTGFSGFTQAMICLLYTSEIDHWISEEEAHKITGLVVGKKYTLTAVSYTHLPYGRIKRFYFRIKRCT